MRRTLISMASALALGGAWAGSWDGSSWVYTPETHTSIAPATSAGTMAGLDAKARGLANATPTTVDAWYWTVDWATGTVSFLQCGTWLFIR